MQITPFLKERFCRDTQLPMKIFQEPYFTERLALYNVHFGCLSQYNRFVEMLNHYGNEQQYMEAYNTLKDTIIEHLSQNPAFQYFAQKEDMSQFQIINKGFPKNSIYKATTVGKHMVSFDMKKANFTALKHYDLDIFDGKETYEDFVRQFTDNEHFVQSKYIRQVVFGALTPKRQVQYEQYLMDKVLAHLLSVFPAEKVVYFSADEIVIELDGQISVDSDEYNFISNTTQVFNDAGITIRAEVFWLEYLSEYDTYIKHVYAKCDVFNGEPLKKSELQVIKNATNLTLPFVLRKMYNLPPNEHDNVFLHEGRLAKFID